MSNRGITTGSIVHVYNRGAKKLPIFRQKSDLWRLLFGLFYMNHGGRLPPNWTRDLEDLGGPQRFVWPEAWGAREPLVSVLAYTILPNHFHLVLKETTEGGISRFMHKWAMAYSKFINEKYGESGSLFQGTYRTRVVENNGHLEYLPMYVMVKNALELYPEGLQAAIKDFDAAYEWAADYEFGSLGTYARDYPSAIVEKDIFQELFPTPEVFREHAREAMLYKLESLGQFDFS